MKVKCLHVNNGEVPVLIEKYGYYAPQIIHLTRGREYTVCGMYFEAVSIISLPTLSYIIRDEYGDAATYPAMLFEVTDSCLTDVEWHFSFNKNDGSFMICYDDFVNNWEHHDRAILRDEPDRSRYKEWCEMIDKIEAEKEMRR